MRHAVRQHLHALDGRGHEIVYHNAVDSPPRRLRWLSPDLVVLHPTFLGVRWDDDFEVYRRRFAWLARIQAPRVALPQDEYDHSSVLEDWLNELHVVRVYSCFAREARRSLYSHLEEQAGFRETLTGFIDAVEACRVATHLTPHARRPFDIVYRAAKLPYWFGSHGQLKHRLAAVVDSRARELGLRTDVSTRWEDTIYGDRWLDFVMSGRATVGCESGSSVLDPRGALQARVREMLELEPDLTFDEVSARMPLGWDSYAFFALSPRHLEAVVTKTAQILVEGRYSGVLEPERHYIPLRRDLSNLDVALTRLADVDAVSQMTERAYADVYESGLYTLESFAEELLSIRGRRRFMLRLPVRVLRQRQAVEVPEVGKPTDVSYGRVRTVARRGSHNVQTAFALWWTFAEALVRQPQLRRLLLNALRHRDTLPVRGTVGDVIRLGVLDRARRHQPPQGAHWQVFLETSDDALVLRTRHGARADLPVADARGATRVVWDHSAIATAVPLSLRSPQRGSIVLGPEGRYEFPSLSRLVRERPSDVVELLKRVTHR